MAVQLRQYSPLTWVVERAFRVLQFLPPQVFFRGRSDLTQEEVVSPEFTAARARRIEYFVIGCLLIEVILVILIVSEVTGVPWFRWMVTAVVGLRIVDIFQVAVNVTLFDQLRTRADNRVASLPRLSVLAFINFLELIACFGCIYAVHLTCLANASTPADGWYFSVITQLTIGYGDLHPVGVLRAVACAQGLLGVAFLVLVFARTVAMLPHIRSTFKE